MYLCIYVYMYDVYACVRVCCMRAWPWAGEMGIRIRRKWISAPDAHPEPEMMVGMVGLDFERK